MLSPRSNKTIDQGDISSSLSSPGFFLIFISLVLWLTIFSFYSSLAKAASDANQVFAGNYRDQSRKKVNETAGRKDPWTILQDIYLSLKEKQQSYLLKRALTPFKPYIADASARFQVPPEIIGAVIMVESGGNPGARAGTSTAKGLMQTIDATFAEAREGLIEQELMVADDPFSPRASIMAGSWYLSKMYDLVSRDRPSAVNGREQLLSWRYPAQYYYVGPNNGRKNSNKVTVNAGGKRLIIDKEAYSKKVLNWAKILLENDFSLNN